jgi:lipopolysaccharide/colanic/teichoic acid biosynthesis glycosyltransferase
MLFSNEFDARDRPLPVLLTDIAASLLLLVAGAPFALLYAALFHAGQLRLSDGQAVIAKEPRAGLQGRPFVSLRFRVKDAGPLAAMARVLHLDDWPQLWNVLSGNMSMVGPRPCRLSMAAELARLLPVHEYRQNARPGITGWAQINLKPSESADAIAEVEYDLYFVRNRSVSLYTYILLHGLRPAV